MSNTEHAMSKQMPEHTAVVRDTKRDPTDGNRLREEWRLIALQWSAAEDKASRFEEGKMILLATLKRFHMVEGKLPATVAEAVARTDDKYKSHIEFMHTARRKANDLKIEMENANRIYWDQNNRDATERAERRMSR